MNMEDYERQEELRRANQLFSESNNLQKRQLDQQEKLSYQQQRQHDELIREQRRLAEQKRIEMFEKEMEDKIYGLKVEIAKSKDQEVKSELQVLLDEELVKKDKYYRDKRIKEEAARQESQKRAKKAKLVSLVKKTIFTIIIGLAALIALLWYFSLGKQDNTKNTFGKSNLTVRKNTNAEKKSSEESSSGSSTSSTSSAPKTKDNDKKVSNAVTTKTNFQVEVVDNPIDIRSLPDINSEVVSACPPGVYTIIETVEVDNYKWGKMESNKGWINLALTSNNIDREVKDVISTTTEWEKPYSYYYVPSNTSTLMMAGFKLQAFGYVTLYRSGAEIMASNSGNPVKGSYTIEEYSTSEQVTSYVIQQKIIVNGDVPETKLVSPNIILKIHVPVSELKKADGNASKDEDITYYGYISNLGQHILTDGHSPIPEVFFSRSE